MALLNPVVVFWSLAVLAAASAARFVLAAFKSPLRHIPAPWYANFTHHVLKYYTVTGQRMYYIDALHQRYGPIVRISPDEVSVADPDSFTTIHRMGSGFNKSMFYQELVSKKHKPGIFTMTDPKYHAARRKLFARAFTTSSLRENCEALVREKVEMAVERLRIEAAEGYADVHKWWVLMSTDIVAQLSFGESFGLLELGKKNRYIQVLDAVASASTLRYELPWFHAAVSFLPTLSMQLLTNTRSEMIAYSGKAVENLHRNKDNKTNLFATILAESEADEKSELSDDVIRGEAANMLIAGSDTVSNSLTYVVWAILTRPGLQKRLEEELAGLDDDFKDATLEKLPLLNAAISESLRLYGAVSGTLPRETPPSGATLGGYHVPGGTTVMTQTYTMHRLPEMFPDPSQFDETRFLPGSLTEKQNLIFSPFGTGSRMCIGIALARMEMRMAIALLFRKCRGLRLADHMTDEMMHMVSFIVVKPAGKKCDVTLQKSQV